MQLITSMLFESSCFPDKSIDWNPCIYVHSWKTYPMCNSSAKLIYRTRGYKLVAVAKDNHYRRTTRLYSVGRGCTQILQFMDTSVEDCINPLVLALGLFTPASVEVLAPCLFVPCHSSCWVEYGGNLRPGMVSSHGHLSGELSVSSGCLLPVEFHKHF